MQHAVYSPRLGNWLAFILPAASFCVFAYVAPAWYSRYRLALIDSAILGAFAGQFLWSAVWCALGPGRWVYRYLVVVTMGIAVTAAVLVGIDSKPETAMERRTNQRNRAIGQQFTHRERARNDVWHYGMGFPLSLLACQLPLVWYRSYRGWRIVFRSTRSLPSEAELLKFGLSDLLGATAGTAIAFGFWRLGISEVSRGPYGTEGAFVASSICVLLSLIIGFLFVPVVPLVLGDRPRRHALVFVAVYLSGIVMVASAALFWLNSPARRLGLVALFTIHFVAMALSALIVFWIARELGYRLIRTRRHGFLGQWSVRWDKWRATANCGQVKALFKWAAIATATTASMCFLFWLVSLSTAKADFGFVFNLEDEITIHRGTTSISIILSSRSAQVARMNLAKPHHWNVPGLEVEHLEDYGGRTWLIVKFSLLMPGLAMAVLAAVFIRSYKRWRKALVTYPPVTEGASKTPNELLAQE